MALYYIGGILKHARAILALSNPTTNSYRRLVPGYEAPVNLAYSQRNRSASVRIPMYNSSPKAKRIEFRCPDPSCNIYLALSATLMAGLDGIENKIDPGEPMDKDIYDLAPEERAAVPLTPASLEEAMDALEAGHDFPAQGRSVHGGCDRSMDQLQARRGNRPASAARVPMCSPCATTWSKPVGQLSGRAWIHQDPRPSSFVR